MYEKINTAVHFCLQIDLFKIYNITGVQFHWTTHDDDVGICKLGAVPQLKATQGIRP